MSPAERAASEVRAQPALIAGRYRIEAALGRGGAAQVLRVTDLSRNKQLALKRLVWIAPDSGARACCVSWSCGRA